MLYKRYLKLSIQHKHLQIKKLKLEINKMEKDVSMNPSREDKVIVFTVFNSVPFCLPSLVTQDNKHLNAILSTVLPLQCWGGNKVARPNKWK